MRVMVTGGAGFIGSHVVDALLAAGHEACALDDLSTGDRANLPSTVPLSVVDIRDRAAVAAAVAAWAPDAVCHQAAQMSVSRSVREPHFDAEVNGIGLLNVLDAVVASRCRRVVFASSGGVLYGEATEPAPEEAPADPVSPYGITKWLGERYLKFYAAEHGLTAVALRYSNVYGPRQNPHGEAGVVAIFLRRLLAGEPARINGDGRYVRDYVFGADVAAANVAALTIDDPRRLPPGVLTSLNVGTGIGTDVNVLEERIRARLGVLLSGRGSAVALPGPVHGPARPGDLRSNMVDAARAARVLGWRPTYDLDRGIDATAAWFAGEVGG